ncbi:MULTISPECIES: carbohydrate ABC transporter permease [Cohnella]|uniref:carbohydrate ABC transporter permease n=1 Tax=Cohnella TaxID=329857 RepID=UPI0009BBFB36|nr:MULTISPECIES: carbohydrate ABC transporter permease [Cohnella]MBN2984717.1 carbohydrate ABC transporter permease [Cohnella algarum]
MSGTRSRTARWIAHIPLLLLSIACIAPIALMVSISLSSGERIAATGYSFWPQDINLEAYEYVFMASERIFRAYGVSLFVTITGTFLSLLVMSMIAYPLSRRDYIHRGKLMFYVVFTMLFHGGLVPTYIVISNYLQMKDTLWVLILPYLAAPWFIIMLRTYFSQLSHEIIEAATVDGCSEKRILFTLIIPMSKPALATIGLLTVLRYWNDWFLGLLYIDSTNLYPLQLLLYVMMANIQELLRTALDTGIVEIADFPSEAARMAMALVVAGPMLLVFPFFQKYFVKGLADGAVKG